MKDTIEKSKKTWKSEIYRIIKENYEIDDIVELSDFHERFLDEIVENVESAGETPNNTLNANLHGLVKQGFLGKVSIGVFSFIGGSRKLKKLKKKTKIIPAEISDDIRKKTWPESVLHQIVWNYGLGEHFTYREFCLNRLPIIIAETRSMGETPDQTLSRTLQELRDCGYLEFVGNNGVYYLVGYPEDLTEFRKKPSKGERLVHEILIELQEDHQFKIDPWARFKDLKHKSFLEIDFIVKVGERKYAIEFDGLQHSKPIERFGGEEAFKTQQERDGIKTKYCEKNNIPLLRLNELNYKSCKRAIRNFLEE